MTKKDPNIRRKSRAFGRHPVAYNERGEPIAWSYEEDFYDERYNGGGIYEPPRRSTREERQRTTTIPGSPRSESLREDPLVSAVIMLGGVMGGSSIDELTDAQNARAHRSVSAGGQLPINGSPGYRDCGQYRGMIPIKLEGAEERLAIFKQWLVHPELPAEDLGRVQYQIEALTKDIENARVWKTIGFEFGDPVDRLFRTVKFPQGWMRRSTNHAMYSDFVDEKGRKRISMFYKSSFYDNDAFMHVVRRFSVERDYSNDHVIRVRVLDGEREIFSAEPADLPAPDRWNSEYVHAREKLEEEQRKVCCAWLDEHYPKHNDPTAHWDDP